MGAGVDVHGIDDLRQLHVGTSLQPEAGHHHRHRAGIGIGVAGAYSQHVGQCRVAFLGCAGQQGVGQVLVDRERRADVLGGDATGLHVTGSRLRAERGLQMAVRVDRIRLNSRVSRRPDASGAAAVRKGRGITTGVTPSWSSPDAPQCAR